MYFVKSPRLFDFFYPDLIWRKEGTDKKIYLTFDDGPDETTTPELLKILDHYEARATFFCVGNKVDKLPHMLKQIRKNGHSIGNHTYNHLKGINVGTKSYAEDIEVCNYLLNTDLFRPPYGSIKRNQIKQLKDQYKIYMWTLMPGDFDKKVTKEKCLQRSIRYTNNGTIIVYHDNANTLDKVLYTIPKYIEHFQKLGYTFKAL